LQPFISDPHIALNYVSRCNSALLTIPVPLFVHMFSAIFCMGCSAIYHLFKDHSYGLNDLLVRFDYGGISILIAGSNIPPLYYSFYCE